MAESEYMHAPRKRRHKPPSPTSPYRYMSWSLADVLRNSDLIYCRDGGIELEKPRSAGCLYVMLAGEFMKVGITTDLRQRLSDLQCASPLLIDLHKAYLPPSDIEILRIEMIAHRDLAPFHVRGEWFSIEGLALFQPEAKHD